MLIPLLNSSTSSLLSYLLSLATLLNSCMNSFIILLPCSSLLNSATFIYSLSSSLNFFLISAKNSPAILYSNNLFFKSSSIFTFQISTDPPYIYERIYCIYSSADALFIFILIYNLHAVTNPEIFDEVPSNTCGLTTSVLAATVVAASFSILSCNAWSWAYSTASYSCYCWAKSSKLIEPYWLMM